MCVCSAVFLAGCGSSDDGAVPGDAPSEFDDAVELAKTLDRGRTNEAELRDGIWGLTAAYCTNINAPSIEPTSQQVITILAFVESNVCPTKSNTYWQEAFLTLEGDPAS